MLLVYVARPGFLLLFVAAGQSPGPNDPLDGNVVPLL